MPSSELLARTLARCPPAGRYWIAYSGGLDSRVLLQLAVELRDLEPTLDFAAVHVHHGLQAAADDFVAHCRETCARLGIPLHLLRVDGRSRPGESPEEAARAARYRALLDTVGPGEILLTAQHRDDQAETLLLQLLRGAGLAGLAAMPEAAGFGHGTLLRPLLAVSRAALHQFANGRGIVWIDDPSNSDLRHDRNFVRQRVMPLLLQRWPGATETLNRTASHCAEAAGVLDPLARDLLRRVENSSDQSLHADRLRHLSPPHQRLVLRQWLRERDARMPSARVLERVLNEVLGARPDRNPVVRWAEGEIRRYREHLYLLPASPPFDPSRGLRWDGRSPLVLPDGNGVLECRAAPGPGLRPDWANAAVTVGYRQGGEAIALPGRDGTHDLRKLFQEAGIPPWVRARIPLVRVGGQLAAVGGLWVAAPFAATGPGPHWRCHWQAPPELGAARLPPEKADRPPRRRAPCGPR